MSVLKKLKEHSDTAGEFWKKFFRCFLHSRPFNRKAFGEVTAFEFFYI